MILIRNIVKVKICGSHCTTNGNMENSRHSNFSGTVRFSYYWVRLLCVLLWVSVNFSLILKFKQRKSCMILFSMFCLCFVLLFENFNQVYLKFNMASSNCAVHVLCYGSVTSSRFCQKQRCYLLLLGAKKGRWKALECNACWNHSKLWTEPCKIFKSLFTLTVWC